MESSVIVLSGVDHLNSCKILTLRKLATFNTVGSWDSHCSTIKSSFHNSNNDKTVHVQIGKGLVEVVENQQIDSPEAIDLVSEYIQPMLDNNVDKIVLGCYCY